MILPQRFNENLKSMERKRLHKFLRCKFNKFFLIVGLLAMNSQKLRLNSFSVTQLP